MAGDGVRKALFLIALVGGAVLAWMAWWTPSAEPAPPTWVAAPGAGGSLLGDEQLIDAAASADKRAADSDPPEEESDAKRSDANATAGSVGGAADSPRPPDEPASTSLAGSLVWHDSVDHDNFKVICRRPGQMQERALYLAPDGQFRLLAQRPARVDVLVYMAGDSVPLDAVFDVGVPEVGVGRDPRLQRIDVTDVRKVTLSYVDRSGQPIRDHLHAQRVDPHGKLGRPIDKWRGHGGQLNLLIRASGQHIDAWARGYERRRLVVHADQTVVLQGSARVRVHLRAIGARQEIHGVTLHLEPVDADGAPDKQPVMVSGGFFMGENTKLSIVEPLDRRADGELGTAVWTFGVGEPGRFRASWSILGDPNPEFGPGVFVEVQALGTEHDVWLKTTATALAAASRRVGQARKNGR